MRLWVCVFGKTAHQPHPTIPPKDTPPLPPRTHRPLTVFWSRKCIISGCNDCSQFEMSLAFCAALEIRGVFTDQQRSISDGTLNSFCWLHLHESLTREILTQSAKACGNPFVLASPAHSWSQKPGTRRHDANMRVIHQQIFHIHTKRWVSTFFLPLSLMFLSPWKTFHFPSDLQEKAFQNRFEQNKKNMWFYKKCVTEKFRFKCVEQITAVYTTAQ